MARKEKTIASEDVHGLYGIGDVVFMFSYINKIPILKIKIQKLNAEIVYKSEDAISNYMRIIDTSQDNHLRKIISLACDSTRIPITAIYMKSRDPRKVFARNCVFWYCKKYMGYSHAKAGAIFSKDHATSIHGIRDFEKENKFQSTDRIEWKKRFIELLNEAHKIDNEVYNYEVNR